MQELEFAEAGKHIHANGCIDKLVNWIHSNLFLLGGIALGLAIPQVKHTSWQNGTLKVIRFHAAAQIMQVSVSCWVKSLKTTVRSSCSWFGDLYS